jgi:hypothetical protein
MRGVLRLRSFGNASGSRTPPASSKKLLTALKKRHPKTRLSEAQLQIARDNGFPYRRTQDRPLSLPRTVRANAGTLPASARSCRQTGGKSFSSLANLCERQKHSKPGAMSCAFALGDHPRAVRCTSCRTMARPSPRPPTVRVVDWSAYTNARSAFTALSGLSILPGPPVRSGRQAQVGGTSRSSR